MRLCRPFGPTPRLTLAGLALLVLLVLLPGCGGVGVSTAGTLPGQLTVYSSLPLQGPLAADSLQIENGEKLALAQVGGRVGRFKIDYASLDDANPKTGAADPGIIASNARVATQDTSTIAYIGELDSAATAVSLSFVNGAGILQVSPASPYVGLTSSLDAGQDEPERFYPSGQRTFARMMPGDPVQAAAQVRLMRTLHLPSVYVIDDLDPFDAPLASIFAEDAKRAGHRGARRRPDRNDLRHGILRGGPQGARKRRPRGVLQRCSRTPARSRCGSSCTPPTPTCACSGRAASPNPRSPRRSASAAAHTYLTTPLLPLSLYPPPAQRVLAEYRRRFHHAAGPYALYGYEAMSAVLLAIHRAGRHGNDREAVIHKFFTIHDRDSVLGRYSVLPSGDTTFSRYAVDRVRGGRLVFYRAFQLSPES